LVDPANNRITAIEIVIFAKQVHQPAAPTSAAFGLTIHFGQKVTHRNTSGQRMPIFTVGCNKAVLFF